MEAQGSSEALQAERERIRREIQELEHRLGVGATDELGSKESGYDEEDDEEKECISLVEDSVRETAPRLTDSISEDDGDDLPEDPETCLQMNLVYQEVIVEKLQDLELLLTHNKEQQAEIMSDLAGEGDEKSKSAKSQSFLFLGHFMKPYFRDKVTGLGPPANKDTKEKATQGIKSFEEFLIPSWKQREKEKLKVSVANDSIQRLLQPKLLRLEFLNKKLEMSHNEKDKNFFRKQIGEIEQEMEAINQMTQRQLLGNRFDDHDWIKIANIDFDGSRNAEDIKRAWQNHEHPSINRAQWSSQEIQQLIEIAERSGCVDWEWIASELQTSRTAYMCLQKYQEFNKDLKKRVWSRKEDQMLTELVQKMRVGNFIPYTKIAYFMEGRNGSQLLHRWSKTLDPSVKKGAWSPAEDALLLKAVAKYGRRDWFKIQEEVPGRVDSQCRERYVYCLNHNIRKGKWTPEEESDLKALVEKHGIGKWSKVASELAGRTDTQCSSKWKTLEGIKPKPCQGTRKRKRRRQLTRSRMWENSSEESSEDWEDEDEKFLEEMEMEQEQEEESELEKDEEQEEDLKIEQKKRRVKHKKATDPMVLDVDRWVPVVETEQPPAKTNSQVEKTVMEQPVVSSKIESQNHRGRPKSSKIWTTFPKPSNAITSVGEVGVGPAERGLSAPTVVPDSTPPLKTVECLVANVQSQNNPKRARRRILAAHLSDRNLDRRLLAEISRWTTARPFVRREIDVVRERMEAIGLSSTPIFVLLLQVFWIDKEGCMQIIKEEMNRNAQSLPANNKNENKSSRGPYLNRVKGTSMDVGNGQTMEMTRFKLSSAPFREKPKTVQELLAEKRRTGGMARAPGPAQRPLIIPQPLIIQQPLQVTMIPQPAALCKVPVGPEPQGPERSRSSSPVQTRASTRRRKPVIESTVGQVAFEKPTLSGKPKGDDEPKMTSTPPNSQLHSSAIVKPMKNDKQAPALNDASVQPAADSSRGRWLQPIAPAPSVQPVLQPNSLMIPLMLPNSTVPIMALVTPQGLLYIPAGTGLPNQNAHGLATVTIASQNNNAAVTTMPLGVVSTSMSSSTATQAPMNLPLVHSQSEIGGPSVAPVLTTSSTKLSSTQPVNVSSLAVCKLIPPSSNSAQIQPTQAPTPANFGTLAPTLTSANAVTPCADLPAVKAIKQVAANNVDSTVNAPPTIQLAQDSGSSGKTVDTPSTETPCTQPSSLAQPEGTKLPAAQLHSDKTSADFKLLSDDKDAVMKNWLEGEGGVPVQGTQTSLPYLPPFASTLRGFSNLLLHKKVLEQNLPDFEAANVNEPVDHKKRLESARVLVSERLQNNPAYQLLKARFLSAFTLPAFLATLPPQGTLTTIGTLAEGLNQDSTEESEYTETDVDSDKELPQQCIADEVTSKELNQPFEIPDDLSFDFDLLGSLETIVGDQSTPEPPNAPEASSALEGESRVTTRRSRRLRKIP